MRLDYVEFADQTILGHDSPASQIIGESRIGAAKYRAWLVKQYEKNGGSIEGLLPLLEKYERMPEEIGIEGANQQEGAMRYRGYLRKIYASKGAEGLSKQLKRQGPSED
ncbi:MAG: hypothetical protein ACRD9S_05745 [Pyrinomonadaceae bacterium]